MPIWLGHDDNSEDCYDAENDHVEVMDECYHAIALGCQELNKMLVVPFGFPCEW